MKRKPMTFGAFRRALRALLIAYAGKNDDGQPNIEADIVDRREYERMHFEAMPYLHPIMWEKKSTEAAKRELLLERLRIARLNLGLASDQITKAADDWMRYERDGKL